MTQVAATLTLASNLHPSFRPERVDLDAYSHASSPTPTQNCVSPSQASLRDQLPRERPSCQHPTTTLKGEQDELRSPNLALPVIEITAPRTGSSTAIASEGDEGGHMLQSGNSSSLLNEVVQSRNIVIGKRVNFRNECRDLRLQRQLFQDAVNEFSRLQQISNGKSESATVSAIWVREDVKSLAPCAKLRYYYGQPR